MPFIPYKHLYPEEIEMLMEMLMLFFCSHILECVGWLSGQELKRVFLGVESISSSDTITNCFVGTQHHVVDSVVILVHFPFHFTEAQTSVEVHVVFGPHGFVVVRPSWTGVSESPCVRNKLQHILFCFLQIFLETINSLLQLVNFAGDICQCCFLYVADLCLCLAYFLVELS